MDWATVHWLLRCGLSTAEPDRPGGCCFLSPLFCFFCWSTMLLLFLHFSILCRFQNVSCLIRHIRLSAVPNPAFFCARLSLSQANHDLKKKSLFSMTAAAPLCLVHWYRNPVRACDWAPPITSYRASLPYTPTRMNPTNQLGPPLLCIVPDSRLATAGREHRHFRARKKRRPL